MSTWRTSLTHLYCKSDKRVLLLDMITHFIALFSKFSYADSKNQDVYRELSEQMQETEFEGRLIKR